MKREDSEEQHAQLILSHNQAHASMNLEATILSPTSADTTEETILITETDDSLRKKLSAYATTLPPTLQPSSPNPRMHSTLALASSLSPTDPLLASALHLCTLTQLLLPTTASPWTININPQPPAPSSHPHTISLLTLHLNSTLEALAAASSQTLLLTLERRLERRSQCQNLQTLLIGILLLHCVEGMSSLFASFHSSDERPLIRPPEYYVAQADKFAGFVVKLFRMRGVGVGIGTFVEEGTGKLKFREGEGDEGVREWVERLGLVEGEGEGAAGEGRFWGGLLLPGR